VLGVGTADIVGGHLQQTTHNHHVRDELETHLLGCIVQQFVHGCICHM
jgi:hypothetical protein